MPRKYRQQSMGLALGLVLLALILTMVNYLGARHYCRGDWTPSKVFSLSPKSVAVLRALRHPLKLTLFMVPPDRFTESVYHETRELVQRFARHSSQISVETIDIDADPTRAQLLAQRYNIYEGDLREGLVVVSSGDRSKYVPRRALADYVDQRLVAFNGEAALLEAVLAVTDGKPPKICFSSGHGEAPTDSFADAGYGQIADELRREAYRLRVLDERQLQGGLPGCDVLVVAGPRRAFARVEVDALDRYLRRRGRLLLLLGSVLDRKVTRYGHTNLEPWLRRWGVVVRDNIVLDPLAVPGEQPLLTWGTREGYTDHAVARALSGRLTIWRLAREVRPAKGELAGLQATALVRSSDKGWAETDLASLRGDGSLRFDAAVDSPGPVPVAVAARWRAARLVVIGSERGVLNRRLDRSDYSRDLFLGAVAWLVGRQQQIAVGPKRPEHVRLALDERQLSRVFLIVVVALPLCSLCLGAVVWWRRRG